MIEALKVVTLINDLLAGVKLAQSTLNSFYMDGRVISQKDLDNIRARASLSHTKLDQALKAKGK